MYTAILLVSCTWTVYATVQDLNQDDPQVTKRGTILPEDSFRSSSVLGLDPSHWEPPKYSESLKNFQNSIAEVKNHFVNYKLIGHANDSNLNVNYIIIAHVINGLSVDVAQNGWKSFDNNFDDIVAKLLKSAEISPREAMDAVNCLYHAANKKIERIIKLMQNEWIDFLCTAKPSSCDVLIHAIVKTSANVQLQHEANLLFMLEKALNSDYITSFNKEIPKPRHQTYLFLVTSKEHLRRLVYWNTLVRKSILSSSDQCPIKMY